jgi:hypothetical protein
MAKWGRSTPYTISLAAGLLVSMAINPPYSRNTTASSTAIEYLFNPNLARKVTVDAVLNSQESKFSLFAPAVNNKDWLFFIEASEYLKYKVQDHHAPIEEYPRFVTYKDPAIQHIARTITQSNRSKEDAAQALLDFVHDIVYDDSIERSAAKNYVRYPLETIVERNGDCEDMAILGAALMRAVGIDVALLYFPSDDAHALDHLALGVAGRFKGASWTANGKTYYFAETTGTLEPQRVARTRIGQDPDGFSKGRVEVLLLH